MQEQPTPRRVTTEDEARERLIEWQREQGGVPTFPASDQTIETEQGWAFFNANGYLGTVSANGEVIEEPGLGEER